jgi:serine protease Do
VADALIHAGRVQRSWLGLEVQPLLKSSPVQHGGLVGGSIAGSPAEKAGFMPGDILVKLAGRAVDVRFPEEVPPFNQFVMRLTLGRPVDAVVIRNGAEKTLRVTPEERQSVEAPIRELPLAGITASNLTSWSAKELNRATRDGVRVRGIRPGGPAAEAKPALDEDDVIVEVDGKPVKSVEALAQVVDAVLKGQSSPVPTLVGFDRGGERLLTVLDVGHPGLEDPGLEARKPWLPITVQVLTRELAQKLGAGERMGVRITRVLDGSAEAAGLKVGDIITAIDGDRVEASQPSDADLFATMIRQYKIGSTVQLTVLRGEEEKQVKVALDAAPRLPREMKKYEDPNFEFRVRDVAAADRTVATWTQGQQGVLVEAVREGGWAALGHLADGDLILAIDGGQVTDVAAVQQKMTRIAQTKPPTVVLEVKRGIRTFFVEMQGGWK